MPMQHSEPNFIDDSREAQQKWAYALGVAHGRRGLRHEAEQMYLHCRPDYQRGYEEGRRKRTKPQMEPEVTG